MWDCGVLFEQTPASARPRAFTTHAHHHAGGLLETLSPFLPTENHASAPEP